MLSDPIQIFCCYLFNFLHLFQHIYTFSAHIILLRSSNGRLLSEVKVKVNVDLYSTSS